MPSAQLLFSGGIGGVGFSATVNREADGSIGHKFPLNGDPKRAGLLTSYVGPTEGAVELQEGHGIARYDLVDVYWADGRRYDMVAGLVEETMFPISGGGGDDLPVEGTPVIVALPRIIDTDFIGDLLTIIGALCNQRGRLGFYDGGTLKLLVDLTSDELWYWASDQGITNPLAAAVVTQAKVSQATTGSGEFALGLLYDSTV